ncbi:MAG: hypothetical protein HC799_14710 [Limnothrix sp. RL_2_0]|nr:hypothetical protein [Limnothrix sp. RL_2_0]
MPEKIGLPSPKIYIAEEKITRYLLVELPKDDKSQFLSQANYTLENWQTLRSDLQKLAQTEPAEYLSSTPYGSKYKIRGNLRSVKVITIWMVVSDTAKFITLIPDKGDKS